MTFFLLCVLIANHCLATFTATSSSFSFALSPFSFRLLSRIKCVAYVLKILDGFYVKQNVPVA